LKKTLQEIWDKFGDNWRDYVICKQLSEKVRQTKQRTARRANLGANGRFVVPDTVVEYEEGHKPPRPIKRKFRHPEIQIESPKRMRTRSSSSSLNISDYHITVKLSVERDELIPAQIQFLGEFTARLEAALTLSNFDSNVDDESEPEEDVQSVRR
jgi:hypothetical protein